MTRPDPKVLHDVMTTSTTRSRVRGPSTSATFTIPICARIGRSITSPKAMQIMIGKENYFLSWDDFDAWQEEPFTARSEVFPARK